MAAAMTIVMTSCCNSGTKCVGGCGDDCTCSEKTTAAVENESPQRNKKVIVARLKVKDDQVKPFIEVASKLVEATHLEEGNLFYALYQSPLDPTEFIFYEEYKTQADFETHAASAHFAAFAEGTKDLTAGALTVDQF
jgi:quinol monooxygenase YgiN